MLRGKMLSFFSMVLLVLSQHIRTSGSTENCFCAPMDTKELVNGTEPLFSQPLKVLRDCGKEARDACWSLCKTLATLAQFDPHSAKGFCIKVKKNISNATISIFSKVCDENYEYTGLTFNKPICCQNKEHVPC